MRKVQWGVLSTAKIGTDHVLPAMQKGERSHVAAIASRDGGRAEAAAAALGIPRAYGSYEELLADPAIEAVYNPLPNHLHVPWSIKALEAGKHVLCEKPIALTAAEAETLAAAAARTGRLVAEAFMVRHHPQWRTVKTLVDGGRIGAVRTIQTIFSYYLDDPANIRNQADIGGGGLYDIGCYAINTARHVFGGEPERVTGVFDIDPTLGTDRMLTGVAAFAGNRTLGFVCGTQLVQTQRVEILGTKGRIGVTIPFNAPNDQPCRLVIDDGRIGAVRTIQTIFSYYLDDPANIRNQADIGGGGLYDIGCYAINTARHVFGGEPERVTGVFDIDPTLGTDRMLTGVAAFAGNRTLGFVCGTQLVPTQRVEILGTKGRIGVTIPFNAPNDQPCRLVIDDGRDLAGGGVETVTLPVTDQYTLQGDAFSRAVLGEVPLEWGMDDAVANMRVIDAFFRAGRSGSWEKP